MTYITSSNLTALTEYLATYIMEGIRKTPIVKPALEEIQASLAETVSNGVAAFCGGASPTGLCYAVAVTADDANQPVIFEQWRVSDIRECIEQIGYTNEDFPTLFRIDDVQFHELLELCADKGYPIYNNVEGLLFDELEEVAEDYFKE